MRETGFTLIELMIVVAIVGVLAVIAGTAYRKYADKARGSEVYAVFGEIRAKEEAFRAENSIFCTTQATALAGCAGGNEDTFFPALLSTGEPKAKSITSGTAWGWGQSGGTGLNLAPGKTQLYCGYNTVAGIANNWGTAGTRGKSLWTVGGTATPATTPWFYMSAACDNDGNSSVNQTYTSGSNTTSVVVTNEGR
jgi:prepilin-type N-terminal cleavage/methylation domain-containing protein